MILTLRYHPPTSPLWLGRNSATTTIDPDRWCCRTS